MKMKKMFLLAICLMLLSGCSLKQVNNESDGSIPDTEYDPVPEKILIQTDLGEIDMPHLNAFDLIESGETSKVPESNPVDTEAEDDNEYLDLALAHVHNYVNVRAAAGTDSAIVGHIYDGAVAQILETIGEGDDMWFRIVSGNVEGYIKAEFFYSGPEVLDQIDNYVTRYIVVLADRLNVREKPGKEEKRIGYVDYNEKLKMLEYGDEWTKVQYADNKIGYVASEYITIEEQFIYAKTLEEEAAEIAAKKAQEERAKESENSKKENPVITVTPPSGSYASTTELRQSIVDYAMQFLGNKYVHGGNSLETGTDCSGFTSLIYKEFGYSISRTPAGQLSGAGRGIELADAQPGDIICYGKSKCTHVAMYIGDGKIIHAANSKKGVVIYDNIQYDTILGVRNVID